MRINQPPTDPALSGVPLSRQTASPVFDDFDAADQLLNGRVTPSGHTWSLSGTGAAAASITGGAFVSASNVYASLPYGVAVEHVAGVFSVTRDIWHGGGQVILIMQSAAMDLQNMIHLQIGPTGWTVDLRVAGVWQYGVVGGDLELAVDGTQYQVAMSRSGNVLTIYPPDGTVRTYTSANIGSLDLKVGTWQLVDRVVNQWIPRWHAVAMGKRLAASRAVATGAAAPGDVARAIGKGFGKRKSQVHTITADGWYRIAYHSTVDNYTIQGKITITAHGLAISHFVGTIFATSGGTPMLDAPLTYGGYHMPNVRIGTDVTGVYIDVQIANAVAAGSVLLNIDAEGFLFLYTALSLNPTVPAIILTKAVSAYSSRKELVIKRMLPDADETILWSTAASGATVTMTDSQSAVRQLGALLAALTVTLPPNPLNGQVATFSSEGGVTSLAVNPGAGETGTYTFAAAALTEYRFQFKADVLNWYRIR